MGHFFQKRGKGLAVLVVLIALGVLLSAPLRTTAQLETPWGGMHLLTLTCTCSGNEIVYIYDYRTLLPLALVYQPLMSVLYQYYNIFATYYVGTYGITLYQCEFIAYPKCITWSDDGQFGSMPGTGTSGI